jgi:hypothetical protein
LEGGPEAQFPGLLNIKVHHFYDQKPENETAGKLRIWPGVVFLNDRRRSAHATERAQRREDYVRVTADRNGKGSPRGLPGDGRVAAGILQLEAAVCGIERIAELRQLREENRKLKGIVADLTLDKHILQEVL